MVFSWYFTISPNCIGSLVHYLYLYGPGVGVSPDWMGTQIGFQVNETTNPCTIPVQHGALCKHPDLLTTQTTSLRRTDPTGAFLQRIADIIALDEGA